jgi:hypothetical protein
MALPSVVDADIDIKGDLSGQIVAGNYNVQIQNSKGCVVNMAPRSDRLAYSMRSFPVNLRNSCLKLSPSHLSEAQGARLKDWQYSCWLWRTL